MSHRARGPPTITSTVIGPVASFVGLTVIGVGGSFYSHYRMPVMWALSHAVTQYVFALVGIYLLALLIDALAPSFGAEKTSCRAPMFG